LEGGEGTIISKQDCREIVLKAHESGLFHTGQRAESGRSAILNGNCCACCSYPIRGGIALGMGKEWPKSHYVASYDPSRCDDCGICVERCPFGAFFASNGESTDSVGSGYQVHLDPEKCFGCGLCATTCSQNAISMLPLRNEFSVLVA
jgi:NAD-dependent dihydropyrimidine dehydrogenase PreA subunit